ncbi:MAG TPA: Crp/Fnr family transcriptional regulator [Thermoanaerobaculia bacterium]|nr:Crp/Fnr family transcriptional regulator [Thermoanaerobaculia bacterium]
MTLALLERIVLFRCLNPAEARALSLVCRLQVCERGQTVFVEGTQAKEMSFVALGTVKIVKSTPTRSVILRIVGAGSPVGIVAAWEGRPYPGTAIAIEPSTIVHVPEREFFSLTDRHPEILRQLLKLMMDRQVQMGQRVSEMTGPVETRVAQALLDLVETAGKVQGSSGSIPLPLSRQEVADLAGTTVETAIRIMSRWNKEGLVLTEGDGFVIPDLEGLRSHLV